MPGLAFDQIFINIKAHHLYINIYFHGEINFSLSPAPHLSQSAGFLILFSLCPTLPLSPSSSLSLPYCPFAPLFHVIPGTAEAP